MAWILGRDRPLDFAYVVGTFGILIVMDRLTRAMSDLGPVDLTAPVLLLRAPVAHALPALLLVALAASLLWLGRKRVWSSWDALEHGNILRGLASVALVGLGWRASSYDFNYVLGQWHAIDRALVLILAIGCLARPILLVPMALQIRVMNAQFFHPLGSVFGQNIDELLVIVLLGLGAVHLAFVATGIRRSSVALLILPTAIAASFYVPGRGKLALDWLAVNDVSNLAHNSYIAGWQGQGDGAWARRIGTLLSRVNGPLKAMTLVMEVGAVVAVAHRKLLRVWLPAWASFHVFTFLLTGFFFLDWVALEAALWVVLMTPRLSEWADENSTPARGAWAVAIVLAGPIVIHPPALAWLDAPVAYGYELEAISDDGRRVHVPVSALSPHEQDFAFGQARFASWAGASGGYGAISSPKRLRELRGIADMDGLASYEATLTPVAVEPGSASELLVTRFFDYTNTGVPGAWFPVRAPSRFWTGRPEPTLVRGMTLRSLEVILVTSMTEEGSRVVRRTPVLTVERGADGLALVTRRASARAR